AVKAAAAEKVPIGDPATFNFVVSNLGDGAADRVRIHAGLTEGLELAQGSKAELEIKDLAAGETRNVQFVCTAKAGGMQKCEVLAEAEGCPTVNAAASTSVLVPHLDLAVAGP